MDRKIWLRGANGFDPVDESRFPEEEAIQVMIHDNPDMIPVEDLGLSRLMVVGRENAFESGYPDLLAVTRTGDIVIVEFKNVGNAQARREVIDQLLDYGACLWKTFTTYDRFDTDLFRAYAASSYCKNESLRSMSLEEAFREFYRADRDADAEATDEDATDGEGFETFRTNLTNNLRAGRFVYVVVCPEIPNEAKYIIEYTTRCLGARFYGVEMDYFRDDDKGVEILLPRSVAYDGAPAPSSGKMSETELLDKMSEEDRQAYGAFKHEWRGMGGSFRNNASGRSVCLPLDGDRRHRALFYVYVPAQGMLELLKTSVLESYVEDTDLPLFTTKALNNYEDALASVGVPAPGDSATYPEADRFERFLKAMLGFGRKLLAE